MLGTRHIFCLQSICTALGQRDVLPSFSPVLVCSGRSPASSWRRCPLAVISRPMIWGHLTPAQRCSFLWITSAGVFAACVHNCSASSSEVFHMSKFQWSEVLLHLKKKKLLFLKWGAAMFHIELPRVKCFIPSFCATCELLWGDISLYGVIFYRMYQ